MASSVPTLGEIVVNQLENTLFIAYGKKKEAFLSNLAAPPKDDFEAYTRPYMITPQDKAEETNLLSIVSKVPKKDIATLSTEYFEAKLRFAPPKKLVTNPSMLAAPKMTGATAFSSSRISGKYQIVAPVTSAQHSMKGSAVIPGNLYSVIEQVFDRYWKMEFEDPATNTAFFANIYSANAHSFNLPAFAAESTSLTIISTRVQNRQYASIEAFKFDMETMFGNILKYFPEGSQPHIMAHQLFRQFQTQWPADAASLR